MFPEPLDRIEVWIYDPDCQRCWCCKCCPAALDEEYAEYVDAGMVAEYIDGADEADVVLTLAEVANEYPLAYSTLAQAAREGRIEARKSGPKTWITTRAAIQTAIAAGKLQPRGEKRRPLYGAEFDLPPRTRRFYPPVMADYIPHFDEFPPMPLRAMLSTQKSKIRDLWDNLTSTGYSE